MFWSKKNKKEVVETQKDAFDKEAFSKALEERYIYLAKVFSLAYPLKDETLNAENVFLRAVLEGAKVFSDNIDQRIKAQKANR